jgi:hypothetical protein
MLNIELPPVEVIRRRANDSRYREVVIVAGTELSGERIGEITAALKALPIISGVHHSVIDGRHMFVFYYVDQTSDEQKSALHALLAPQYAGIARIRATVVREGEHNTGNQAGTLVYLDVDDEAILGLVDLTKIDALDDVTGTGTSTYNRNNRFVAGIRFGVKSRSRNPKVLEALARQALVAIGLVDAGIKFEVEDHFAYSLFPEYDAK